MSTFPEIVNFHEQFIRCRIANFSVHLNSKGQSKSHFVVAQNSIFSTCSRYIDISDFVNFLEAYNRYEVQTSRVKIFFNRLSHDISPIFVA